jgi:DegV family protein with EDD domain
MSTVKIVTDSTCDLPAELIRQYDIRVVPLRIAFGDEEYEDGVTISSQEFHSKLEERSAFPTTFPPNENFFVSVYESCLSESDTILSMHISKQLSQTLSVAREAIKRNTMHFYSLREKVSSDMRYNISILDTMSASLGLGLLVVYAAKLAQQGKSLQEVIDRVQQLIPTSRVLFSVGSLEYLRKGGRIGTASAFIGNLLNLKPILSIENGVVETKGKVLGWKKFYSTIEEIMKRDIDGRKILLGIADTPGNEGDIKTEISGRLQNIFHCEEVVLSRVGATIGTHAGPGSIEIAYVIL